MTNIDDKFTPCPTILIYLLDSDCLKLFMILSQKETYYRNKGKLENGYFQTTIDDISKYLKLKNKNDVRCAIEALYSNKLIDVICTKIKGRNIPNQYKINRDKVNEYNKLSLYDIIEFEQYISKLERGSKTTYDKKNIEQNVIQDVIQNVSTNIDNIDNTDNIDNNTNILKDKDNIKNEIDNIFDIESYINTYSVPNDIKSFADNLNIRATSFLDKYNFNEQLIDYGREYINSKMEYLNEFIDKFTMLERERNI